MNWRIGLVFCIILEIVSSKEADCPKYSIPKRSYLYGYVDEYNQNLTGYPLEFDFERVFQLAMDNIFNREIPSETTFKFLSITMEPFLFTKRDSADHFFIWGPNYSLMKEAVLYLNYR